MALATVAGYEITRPTADRVKENIFNILANELPGARVLDLFSGSGALGIEALSRGAHHVTFVENHPEAISALRDNLQKLRVSPEAFRVVSLNVSMFLARPMQGAEEFAASIDLVFADPPYESTWYNEAIGALQASGLCTDECRVLLEMAAPRAKPSPRDPPAASTLPFFPGWKMTDSRTYGKTRIEFWERASLTVE